MKKILITILAAISMISMPVAFADNHDEEFVGPPQEITAPTIKESTTLDEATFNVNDILSLDGGQQENNFFQDNGNAPIVNFILSVIDFAVRVIGSIAVLLFIIAGFRLMLAQGNQQQIDSAKEMIKYASFGLIATFLSYTLIITIQAIFDAA